MQKLIVICGPGGTGKTTLGKVLSKELHVLCIHKDEIKAAIYDSLGIYTNDSFSIFTLLVDEQLAEGKDLIIEACLNYEEDTELINEWKSKYNLDVYVLICSADPEVRRERIISRERHISHQGSDKVQLDNLDKIYDYSAMPGKHIEVVSHMPVEEMVVDIKKQII